MTTERERCEKPKCYTFKDEIQNWRLEIDCEPGPLRPGDYLPEVLEGLGVEKDPEDTVYRFLGNWCWEFQTSHETLEKVFDTAVFRISKLYVEKKVRFGGVALDD